VEDFFFKLGRKAGTKLRKGRWLWASLTGGEAEALEAEYVAGCDLALAFDRENPPVEEPRTSALLASISTRLCGRLTNKERHWRVVAMQGHAPGAFALPGGFIYVSSALIELCRFDQDEIACVVGHEMGHVVRGHAMERITRQLFANTATRAVRIPSAVLSRWVVSAGWSLLSSAYSQDQELDADEFGARLAAAAGYDPRGAIRALSRFAQLDARDGGPMARYFASHPPVAVRIEKLTGLIRVKSVGAHRSGTGEIPAAD